MSRNTHFNPRRRVFSTHPNTTFEYSSDDFFDVLIILRIENSELIPLPDLTGFSQFDAQTKLKELGFSIW